MDITNSAVIVLPLGLTVLTIIITFLAIVYRLAGKEEAIELAHFRSINRKTLNFSTRQFEEFKVKKGTDAPFKSVDKEYIGQFDRHG